MRLWSLHPKYLDVKGLVALWRESLLAKKVLEGNTRGYKNHPQLLRFQQSNDPSGCMNQYLFHIYQEAARREYNFNQDKIGREFEEQLLPVTRGQMKYEAEHLLKKLQARDPIRYEEYKTIGDFQPHPLFTIVNGEIEAWERVK